MCSPCEQAAEPAVGEVGTPATSRRARLRPAGSWHHVQSWPPQARGSGSSGNAGPHKHAAAAAAAGAGAAAAPRLEQRVQRGGRQAQPAAERLQQPERAALHLRKVGPQGGPELFLKGWTGGEGRRGGAGRAGRHGDCERRSASAKQARRALQTSSLRTERRQAVRTWGGGGGAVQAGSGAPTRASSRPATPPYRRAAERGRARAAPAPRASGCSRRACGWRGGRPAARGAAARWAGHGRRAGARRGRGGARERVGRLQGAGAPSPPPLLAGTPSERRDCPRTHARAAARRRRAPCGSSRTPP